MFTGYDWEGGQMSKPSRRAYREKIKAENKQYKKAQRELLQDEMIRGLQSARLNPFFVEYHVRSLAGLPVAGKTYGHLLST